MTPLYHPASQIVYAAKASDVRTVIVGGRVLMSGGNIATLDLERISTEIDVISRRIKERQP